MTKDQRSAAQKGQNWPPMKNTTGLPPSTNGVDDTRLIDWSEATLAPPFVGPLNEASVRAGDVGLGTAPRVRIRPITTTIATAAPATPAHAQAPCFVRMARLGVERFDLWARGSADTMTRCRLEACFDNQRTVFNRDSNSPCRDACTSSINLTRCRRGNSRTPARRSLPTYCSPRAGSFVSRSVFTQINSRLATSSWPRSRNTVLRSPVKREGRSPIESRRYRGPWSMRWACALI